MDNPYAAPATDVRNAEYDVAGASPYTVAQMRSAFTRFAWAYWGYVATAVFLGVVVGIMSVKVSTTGGAAEVEAMPGTLMAMGVVGLVFAVVAILMTVFMLILLYRYWAVMQPYTKRTTPGKAVGFLFIPLFNLYWMFVAYHGLAKDIDGYLDRNRGSQAPRPQTGLVLATVILILLSFVPVVGNFAGLALLVLLFLMKLRLNNSIIGIIQDRGRQQASAAPTK